MSVLSNIQIRQYIQDGHIVCHPFNAANISYASLDVTLGYYYYTVESQNTRTLYNPFDPEDIERYYDGPHKAMPHKQWCKLNGLKTVKGIPDDHPIIPIKPGKRMLAHTHEFFGIKPPGAYMLKSRSSWARNGVAVCLDAGWVDPGCISRLNMQIYNLNPTETILLPVGERIAQAVFFETGEVEGSYGKSNSNNNSGKYQQGETLDSVIASWSPDQMLPKANKDFRGLPPKIEGLMYD